MIDDEKIRKNIICLRKFYGETQKELADAIGHESQSVNMWEKGKRKISTQNLELIAEHYHITVNDLIYEDYSDDSGTLVIKENGLDKMLRKMFHLVQTPQAKCNSHFIKGCEMAIEAIFGDEDYSRVILLIQSAIDAFEKSIEDGIEYAPDANIICLILFKTSILFTDELNTDVVSCIMQPLTPAKKKESLKYEQEIEMFFEKKKQQIEQLNELLIPHLINLKKSVSFSMLADYYIALRYYLGLIDNGFPLEENWCFGVHLMKFYKDLDNKFAKSFMEGFIEVFDYEEECNDL